MFREDFPRGLRSPCNRETSAKSRLFASRAPVESTQRIIYTSPRIEPPVQQKFIDFSEVPEIDIPCEDAKKISECDILLIQVSKQFSPCHFLNTHLRT